MENKINNKELDSERMGKYKFFSSAFIYPNEDFFALFPMLEENGDELKREYDFLFRAKEIWLYGSEYTIKSEFQRSNCLADISGFYKAFGVEPEGDRPDLLSNELDFMYYLIFKKYYALENDQIEDGEEKAAICDDAQKKFFDEHLYKAAKEIGEKILSRADKESFYAARAEEMLEFIGSEQKYFQGVT